MNDILERKTQYIWENGSYKSRKEMTMYLSIDNDATTKNYFAINKIGRKTSIKLVKIEDENVKEFRKVNIDNHIRKLLIESLKAYTTEGSNKTSARDVLTMTINTLFETGFTLKS